MKIKINNNGFLEIELAGIMKLQACPKNSSYCGDWCPLFGEHEEHPDDPMSKTIEICNYRILGYYIEDERGK